MQLRCGSKLLSLVQPCVMGVLNITPDSFSDGGRFLDPAIAVDNAVRMVEEGAVIIDVGGESTRPGAAPVAIDEELRRVIPVIERLSPKLGVVISIDTRRPKVMRAALSAGAELVNDINALQDMDAMHAVANTDAGVCLMHMQGDPLSMQQAPEYGNVVTEVRDFLTERVAACEAAGIARERIAVDPGIGFGKTPEHNLRLIANLHDYIWLGRPVVIGVSRKSTVGRITGRPVDGRLAGSVALATLAAWNGAAIIRAHDVAATVDAMKTVAALRGVSS
ncbi:MAG TPA: dihydropteroate synthase [Steroidobacteraceae bacterium]|nr:dihydropteroate synthase [Steroidobacteraceae bacterium]